MSRPSVVQRARRDPYLAHLLRDPCTYCGAPAVTLDHVVALRRGGEDGWENLTAVCASCNNGKSGRALLSWLAYRAWVSKLVDDAQTLAGRWYQVGRAT